MAIPFSTFKALVDFLLINESQSAIVALVGTEAENILLGQDLAKNPPTYTPLSASQWALLKSFLLDGAGPNAVMTALPYAYSYLLADAQIQFLFMVAEVFKTLLKQFAAQLVATALVPSTAIIRVQTYVPNVNATYIPGTAQHNFTTYAPVVTVA